ncbi:MAG: heavy metal translocating P-type ATPase [Gemmatimonadetes bacterium]|nr:heavy metal translocating P-type ATPase [Gemmatimonadota bacterium]MBK7783863.1 heavy metal translocating P-type ATPase [Gemmatimonadota bacterium]MBK7924800.1 heavy metal translocating P-type ATPase [Gemmatimonadota bacterium]MBK9068089.1 heavy metal translocating P-type ATPase [Gemmatimonadota bacterium]
MSVPTTPKPGNGPDRARGAASDRAAPGACCPHCGAAVEGDTNAYCCRGCEMAAAIIRGAGLERYYQDRTDFAPRPDAALGEDWSRVEVATDPAGRCEARLVVDGLRCASCVWVTEKVLERTPGVEHAMVSYATGRATLRWDPAKVDLPALARRIAALGYRPRPLGGDTAPDRGLLLRMGFAAIVAIATMGLYEGLYAGWWYGSIDPGLATLFRWTSLLLSTPVTFWCAEPFFAGAWSGLRNRVLHMDLPIALGIAITYLHGLVATLLGQDAYLDSLTMLVALLLAGRVLESRSRRRTTDAAAALVGTVPQTARRLTDAATPAPTGARTPGETLEVVPVSALHAGDRIDVGAGEELAADGTVVEGSGQVRLALLTGEAAPVLVGPGDQVVAGTLLVDGAITVRVEAVGGATVVHRMAAELRAAQDRGLAPTSADRIAPWFTVGTLVVAALTLAGWWVARGLGPAIANTVAVLVVACPCALALAHPLAAAAGLASAARRGLLLRSSDALLRLADVTVAGLDKTGTLTAGTITVTEASDATLRVAAGLERYSVHPIARAITAEAARRGIPLPQPRDVRELPGTGISGEIDGRRWSLASAGAGAVRLTAEDGTGAPGPALIRLGDTTRDDARQAVEALRRLGIRSVLLTGDHAAAAKRVGQDAGIPAVQARRDPAAKSAWVRAQQQAGERVLFAGDGLNDGPALAAADVGIAMASGAASTVLVADGIVSTGALGPVVAGIRAGQAARRMVNSSLRQAIIYNVVSVGAAALGLVNPLVAAILMPISSTLVIWNATRVERLVRNGD